MMDDPIPALKEQLGLSILAEIGRTSQLRGARMLGLDEARMSNIELACGDERLWEVGEKVRSWNERYGRR